MISERGTAMSFMFMTALLLLGLMLALISPARADTPCDFKGISVGDKMTPAELMKALGVKDYKVNPPRPSFDETLALVQKYSLMVASEIQDWEIGPYCEHNSCRVPVGVGVGNHNSIPVNVFVSFDNNDVLTEIDVTFNEEEWNDVLPILNQKYGPQWNEERLPDIITNYETKKSTTVERINLTHKTTGTNPRTNDHCEIWANNFDLVFEHHDPLGVYHSVMAIKLISKNF
jgi:hypothetical protein